MTATPIQGRWPAATGRPSRSMALLRDRIARPHASRHPRSWDASLPAAGSRSALHVLAPATGSVGEESVSHEWLRARLASRGRRDEICEQQPSYLAY